MALIKCPECEQAISDKAAKCPKCGYPIQEYLSGQLTPDVKDENNDSVIDVPDAIEPVKDVEYPTEKNVSSKKRIFTTLIGCVIAVIIIIGVVAGSQLSKGGVTVEDISISKWKLVDSTDSYDYYEGTITSEQKKPFVAIIGQYEDAESTPSLVYVEDGIGIFETSEKTDEDPSIKYRAIGYLSGQTVQESDITVKYSDSDYYDLSYLESTHCDVLIDIEMNHTKTGLLIFDIVNETNNETLQNMVAVVINGKTEYSYYASLPYKARGVELTIIPKIFCVSKAVKEEDYIIEEEYTAEKTEGTYVNYYSGEQTLAFPNYSDGFILYTSELKEGGAKDNRNVVKYRKIFLYNGECTITTYDSVDDDETILMPKYEFDFVGFITWTPLEGGNKI